VENTGEEVQYLDTEFCHVANPSETGQTALSFLLKGRYSPRAASSDRCKLEALQYPRYLKRVFAGEAKPCGAGSKQVFICYRLVETPICCARHNHLPFFTRGMAGLGQAGEGGGGRL